MVLLVVLAAALIGASCAADGPRGVDADGGDQGIPAHSDAQRGEGIGHVHGAGIDPGSGDVFVGGHHGLWRVSAGEEGARRVGVATHDFMGLTVAGPDRLFASGHPEPGAGLPGNLGLIESDDGGVTWRPVSLMGEADFHAMDVSGQMVVGHDSVTGRLLVSTDLGRTWAARNLPAPVISLAVNPGGDGAVVVSTPEAILRWDMSDGWVESAPGPALLAWATPARLVRVGADGSVALSSDGGTTWQTGGSTPVSPAAVAATGDLIVIVDAEGAVLASRDDGATWGALGAVPM
jgi:photosystem II stability/assembly factor-like uncharacterized protein